MLRLLAIGVVAGAAAFPFPQVIKLPNGFQPEGIEVGKGNTFYVGSRLTGAIYRGNLRTGGGQELIAGGAGRPATGIELDPRNRLFVAGAGSGGAWVYSANTGGLIRAYNNVASAPTFINDVVVTPKGAYFTDSQKAVLYKVPIGPTGTLGEAQTISLGSPFALEPGFNLNGIDATPNGNTLIAVQSNTGKLWRINAATGANRQITLAGGETVKVQNGDGILLTGKTLYVVQNTNEVVAVISLSANLTSGRIVARLTDPDFEVPTTIDDHGRRLYAVNARFGVTDPSAEYQVVQLAKPRGR
jgi:sugar lactone lactonase YvrE